MLLRPYYVPGMILGEAMSKTEKKKSKEKVRNEEENNPLPLGSFHPSGLGRQMISESMNNVSVAVSAMEKRRSRMRKTESGGRRPAAQAVTGGLSEKVRFELRTETSRAGQETCGCAGGGFRAEGTANRGLWWGQFKGSREASVSGGK